MALVLGREKVESGIEPGAETAQHLRLAISEVWDVVVNHSASRFPWSDDTASSTGDTWMTDAHLVIAEQLLVAAANRLSRVIETPAGETPFLSAVHITWPPRIPPGMASGVIARQTSQAAERFAQMLEDMTPRDARRACTSDGGWDAVGDLVTDIMARVELHLHAVVDPPGRHDGAGPDRLRSDLVGRTQ